MTCTPRKQEISIRDTRDAWMDFTVTQYDTSDAYESRTRVRACPGKPFVDLEIEQYTGRTRRAKSTGVRLEEEAARKLYWALGRALGEKPTKPGIAPAPADEQSHSS